MSIRQVLKRLDGTVTVRHEDGYTEAHRTDGLVIVERAGRRSGAMPNTVIGLSAEGLSARLSDAEKQALAAADSATARAVRTKLDAGEIVSRDEIEAIRAAGLVAGDVTARAARDTRRDDGEREVRP